MTLYKRGDAKIENILDDKEHDLDDEGTRKEMKRAARELKKIEDVSEKDAAPSVNPEN